MESPSITSEQPATLKPWQVPCFDRIPAALRAGQQHVVWQAERRADGKIGKTPYIARAALQDKFFRASSTKPQNWSSFSQAKAAYTRGGLAGIGRVLTSGLVFGDIDHCIDRATGTLDPAALEILALIHSYKELSPSGDGVHFFLAGQLPPDAQNIYHYKGLKIELYESGRYATLTGRPVPGIPFVQDVTDQQATLVALIARFEQWQGENTSGVCVCGSQVAASEPQALTIPRAGTLRNSGSPASHTSASSGATASHLRQARRDEDLPPDEQAILAAARSAANGQTFSELWAGRDPKRRNDESQADFDLVLMLLYWAGDDPARVERIFQTSPRYLQRQGKMDRLTAKKQYTYLQLTIYNALRKRQRVTWRAPRTSVQADPPAATQPAPTPAHQARRIRHAHHWERERETEAQRQQKLAACAAQVASQVEQHIQKGSSGLLVANVAPGAGKSSTVATLGERTTAGDTLNLAWIAERRDMTEQVAALKYYRQIEPCTRHNCPDHHLHNALAERGYNAWSVHKHHPTACSYSQQFQASGSAVYQLAHVQTRYPAQHAGIIIDELDIAKWLPEREITLSRLTAALKVYATDSTADRLMRAVSATITDQAQAKRPVHGLDLFNALDRRCGGQLANWLGELAQDSRYTNTHPWHNLEEDDPAALAAEADSLAPVVLPHIVAALLAELVKWQRGAKWNSCLRIGPGPHSWALFLSERLRFTPGEQGLPARVILDATADAEILSRLFGEQVQLSQAQIDPPPGTRHLAVRTGKRYGKTSLCATRRDGKRPDLARAIAEVKFVLRELDPTGEALAAHQVGLISFMGCVDLLGEALGIPPERRLHFWAARGSNALEDCTILLVVGTPTVHPDTVTRLTRALWADDPQPISTETEVDAQGIRRYVDARVERLNAYLTRSELTQCAHRSRALRYPDRTIVTMCLGEIDYLPATETIVELPQLTPDGRERWAVSRQAEQQRLAQARERLALEGKNLNVLTVRELKAVAGVSTDAAADYLRKLRNPVQQTGQQEQQKPHTHTPPVFSSVPENPSREIHRKVGYSPPETIPPPAPPPQRQPDMGDLILAYGEQHAYPALTLGDVRIEADKRAWSRFVWMAGPTRDQRRRVYEYILAAG
jgi:primase-polymerase (primpol)-like protein